jgi:hypothetical protein
VGNCFGLAGLIVQVLSLVMGGGTRMVGLVRLEVFQLWNGDLSTLLVCFVLVSLVQRRTILGLAGTAVQVLLPVMGGGMRMVGLADLRWISAEDPQTGERLCGELEGLEGDSNEGMDFLLYSDLFGIHHYRPRMKREDPPNLSILLSGGKETNKDSPSNGE